MDIDEIDDDEQVDHHRCIQHCSCSGKQHLHRIEWLDYHQCKRHRNDVNVEE